MNTNKFFEAFTELDNDLIENALPQTSEPEIARPAERIRLWKPIVSAAALLVLVCGVTVAGVKLYNSIERAPADSVSESSKPPVSAVSSPNPANSSVNYSYISIDEQVYFSARELVNKSDIAVTGKVTDITFELHDHHTGELLTEYSEDAWLCTIYDVDVIKAYKGDENKKVRIITYNGLENYEVSKQLELVGEHHIPVLEKPDDISLGEEYLFLLSQPVYDNSAMMHLINHSQGAFCTDQPTVKERYSQASLNDIVDCLTNADNHSEEVSVIHNSQHVSLSDWQYTTLSDTISDILITGGIPELNTTITEQDINEYSTYGYVVKIQYNDFNFNEPMFGESSDKRARVICSVTVLIGVNGEPSYLTYSYISFSLNGASEPHDGGTYALSDSSREQLLQILGNQVNNDHNNDHDHDNDTHDTEHNNFGVTSVVHHANHITLSDQSSTALMDAVMQTVTTECLPEGQLQMVLSDQRIKECGKNGYAVTIQYNDIDEPTYGESSDKKARGICNATVLIGEEGEPSYITYSYIVFPLNGASEHQDGGTYFLSDGSRERLLQILENQANNDHDSSNHDSEHDNADHNNEHDNNTHETEHHNEPDVISTAHHAHH